MTTFNWPGFGIAAITPTLDQPAQVNRSAYTGVRGVASNPWHGKWSFKVQLGTQQGDVNFQAIRAFFTGLKGPINNFHLPAVEAAQNANTGVTLSASAAQGATSLALTGVTTALVPGNMVTIAGQLLSLTSAGSLSGGAQTINFMPALRTAASSGASIETAKPYALVALTDSSFSWDIGQWRRYGLSFTVDEDVGATDGADPALDVWTAGIGGSSSGTSFTFPELPSFITRSLLAAVPSPTDKQVAYLTEPGREGVFVFTAANVSTLVTTDTAQGIYVAPASDTTGASGAWVREFNGAFNVRWFGAVGNGVTDDSAAFVAAIAFLKSSAVNPIVSNEFKASARLFIPASHYYLGTTTLDITHTFIIEGDGGMGLGSGGGCASKLRWAANTTGIRIQSEHTSGASTYDSVAHDSGAFTTIRQLHLLGPLGGTGTLTAAGLAEGEYHGIHAKGTVFLDNVTVESFQGDGLYAHTSSGAHDATEGYSNASRAYNCIFHVNRNGGSLSGADANVWTFIGCQAISNRACGFDDQSFLGNTYVGCHTNGNGVFSDNTGASGFPAYVVSNGGNRYCPVQGQEPTASTTAPTGTADTSVWLYLGAGGTTTGIPAWTSGMSLRCAAPYRTNNENAQNLFQNCYEEGNQGFSQFVHPTLIQGGLHGQGAVKGLGAYARNSLGFYTVDNFSVKVWLNGEASQWDFGPQGTTAASDNTVNWHTTDNNIIQSYKSWTAGVATIEYTHSVNKTNGVIHDARLAQYFSVAATNFIILGTTTMGFFGSFGTAKPTVTGSRGGNAALASLLTALAGLGLLTDSSSA